MSDYCFRRTFETKDHRVECQRAYSPDPAILVVFLHLFSASLANSYGEHSFDFLFENLVVRNEAKTQQQRCGAMQQHCFRTLLRAERGEGGRQLSMSPTTDGRRAIPFPWSCFLAKLIKTCSPESVSKA